MAIEEKLEGDQATLEEFALFFVQSVAIHSERRAQEIALEIADIVGRHFSVLDFQIISFGSFGAAARILDSDDVLKLTTDHREVEAAAALQGLELKRTARIYKAGFLGDLLIDHVSSGPSPLGAILQEFLLEPDLSEEDARKLRGIVFQVKSDYGVNPATLNELPKAEAARKIEAASIDLVKLLGQQKAYEPLLEIAAGIRELQSHGVFVTDTHPSNIGRDEKTGELKIFDLGVSQTSRKRKAHVLKGPVMGASPSGKIDIWREGTVRYLELLDSVQFDVNICIADRDRKDHDEIAGMLAYMDARLPLVSVRPEDLCPRYGFDFIEERVREYMPLWKEDPPPFPPVVIDSGDRDRILCEGVHRTVSATWARIPRIMAIDIAAGDQQ